jgi:hypothetical protein
VCTLRPADDDIVLDDVAFLGVLRSSDRVRQRRWGRVYRHDEPSGFQTWVGGPGPAGRTRSLTVLRVIDHDAPMPARVVGRLPPQPPRAAVLLLVVEVDGVPLTVEVPHTRTAASVKLPVDVSLALGGALAAPARWYADAAHFAQEQRSAADDATGAARAPRSLVDLRLFEGDAGALVTGIVEHVERVASPLVGDVTTLVVRTIVDIPLVVWCAPTTGPPPLGAVFDGLVATSGFSPQLV